MSSKKGFRLLWERKLAEYDTWCVAYRHETTGARIMSMQNSDANKVFGVSFRTPPRDSTGVAHILEHSVLCGSRRYPVKEPFVELLKGSLQTFLNAFTFPDKTCYPVASANETDFYNLIDVYLDAVFHPRITPDIFAQEGWHYELDDPGGPLTYKGVVYNEMKGAYSSPDSLLAEFSQQSVFPDNTYGLDSGGHPEAIPDLTYEDFHAFHQRFYHPANAWIWFWGDDDPRARLDKLAQYLDEFGPLQVDSHVATQPARPGRRFVERVYAGDPEESRSMLTVNWLLPETADARAGIACRVLEEILVGMSSSPLRKALIDSGLGEDLAGIGLETDLRQMYFSCGLKGMDPADADKVEQLMETTLTELADTGLNPEMVEAGLNTLEFDWRENNTGRFPRGLNLMVRSLSTWLYDADPLALLAFDEPLADLKQRLARGEKVFENLIRELLLDNPHKSVMLLTPDRDEAERMQRAEQQRLDQALEAMDTAERKQVAEYAARLAEQQARPDSPADLARIPKLSIADLPAHNRTIPTQAQDLPGAPGGEVCFHDLPTNGIVYLDALFDLGRLETHELPYVELFGRALLETGTDREDYASLDRRIARKTGGVGPATLAREHLGDGAPVVRFGLRAKAAADKASDLAGILEDVLARAVLTDKNRIRQMVLEEKARAEQRLIPAGHGVVHARLRAGFTPSGHAVEVMGGVAQLEFLRDLAKRLDTDWDQVAAALESIRAKLLAPGGVVLNATMDEDLWRTTRPAFTDLVGALPGPGAPAASWNPEYPVTNEGLAIQARVNYVGKAVNLYEHGYAFQGQDLVVSRFLRNAYLWDRIRVQGGAYGAFSFFDRHSGILALVSYRDPNLERTLGVFDSATAFLSDISLDREELTKSVVGTIGDIDAYQLPDAQGWTAMVRRLTGVSDEERQKVRDQVMSTTEKDFRRFAEAAGLLAQKGRVVVMGSAGALETARGNGLDMEITRVN
jgi:Zn-dependent M16 (insulinase) family peptidase